MRRINNLKQENILKSIYYSFKNIIFYVDNCFYNLYVLYKIIYKLYIK